ncbi:MAG TPA: DnaB-like helicase C-terminal domain-containing protein, partial [Stellaceae bacterium]|nr:DnaB-like helicase C-terminal domain-containing protein [Stellaceae bacterium]
MNSETADRVTPLRVPPERPAIPSNSAAEQSLIGSILLDNRTYEHIADRLYEEHFFTPVHGRIYAACGHLIAQGQVANPITLKTFFDRDAALIDIGGAQYLVRLAESAVTLVNASVYADTIIDCYRRRVMIALGEEIVTRAYQGQIEDPVDRQLDEAGERIFDLADLSSSAARPRQVSGGDAVTISLESAQRAYREPGKLAGISSGITALDRLLGGFVGGDLYILGGRPGAGKSSLIGSLIWAAAEAQHPTILFSGEMTAPQFGARLLAAITGISTTRQRRGDLVPSDWERLTEAQRQIAGWPLLIDDGPMGLSRLQQQTRQWRRAHRTAAALVMFDYLQLISSGREESKFAEVGRVSKALKGLAKTLDVPVIAAAQLSRGVESRDDKRPMMSDLRQSGEVEEDADAIILLYRQEYYLSKSEPQLRVGEADTDLQKRHAIWSNALADARGKAEVLLAKSRHGPEGTAHVRFD